MRVVPPIRLHITLPYLQVTTHLPEVEVDAQQAWNDLGLKHIGEAMRERAQRGQAAALRYIGAIAQEGDRMAQVEISDNVVVELAKEKWPPHRELNVGIAPKQLLDVRVTTGRVDVALTPGRVIVELPHIASAGRHIDVRA